MLFYRDVPTAREGGFETRPYNGRILAHELATWNSRGTVPMSSGCPYARDSGDLG